MKLPVLVSVPHAGLRVPPEIASSFVLSPREIAEDGDEGAREIYAIEGEVARHVTTEIARAAVDLNRAETDRRRDGVVKTHTCWNVPIYDTPLADDVVERLLEKYHRPYHQKLTDLARTGVRFGLDGHTMAAQGPPVGPDPGTERPPICLGVGDGTFPKDWTDTFVTCLEDAFGRTVTVNDPFAGGHIARSHAAELPWVQVEMSRAPFASPGEKRAALLEALESFCARVLR